MASAAIILFGVLGRSFHHVHTNFFSHLVAPLKELGDVDIFYHSWEVERIENPRSGEFGIPLSSQSVARFLGNAVGQIESQSDFDELMDWPTLIPLQSHSEPQAQSSRTTVINLRRALESAERAWKLFERERHRDYDRIIVTRCDLNFLQPLAAPQVDSIDCQFLWIPRFQSWGGVNDRFALGSHESIKYWCCRTAFADGWLFGGNHRRNSESMLLHWLQRNRVKIEYLDFLFQRVRMSGEIAEMDRPLSARSSGITLSKASLPPVSIPVKQRPENSSPRRHQRFLILARKAGEVPSRLGTILGEFGRAEIILDSPGGDGIWHDDDVVGGFGGLMSNSGPFPEVTAWSRAMYHLSLDLNDNEDIWFVEDDVAGSTPSFRNLITATLATGAEFCGFDIRSKENDERWPHWHYANGLLEFPWRSFKPLSMKSARLIRAALEFRNSHGRFIFHEILFPTLAKSLGIRCLDWNEDMASSIHLGVFRYRPELREIRSGVCHPVKSASIHAAICELGDSAGDFTNLFPGARRFRNAIPSKWSIQQDEYVYLLCLLKRHDFKTVTTLGMGPGISALLDSNLEVRSYSVDSLPEFQGNHDLRSGRWQPKQIVPGSQERVEFELDADAYFVFAEAGTPTSLYRHEFIIQALQTGRPVVIHDVRNIATDRTIEIARQLGSEIIRIESSKGMLVVLPTPLIAEKFKTSESWDSKGYRTISPTAWFNCSLPTWEAAFFTPGRAKILEVGALDGASACLILDRIAPNPQSEVHAIDFYDQNVDGLFDMRDALELLEGNARLGNHEDRIKLYEGEVRDILAWMITEENSYESFDLIHIGRWATPAELIENVMLSWNLLRPQGTLIFPAGVSDINPVASSDPHPVFQLKSLLQGRFKIVLESRHLAVRKLS